MSYIKSRPHQLASAPRLHGATLAALAGLAMPLAAQGQAAEPPPAMAEVKVTASAERLIQAPLKSSSSKFTAALLDTPKSVTVIRSELIAQTGAVSLTDALRSVPGITIGSGEGGNPVGDNLFIRGYNAQTDTYIDGIRDTGSQSREIFALEQVEVVKGPNSAYGGRSSAGGSVNLISKTPQAENFFNASAGFGTADYHRATVDINRVLDDNVAVRLNLMGHDAGVAGRDVINGNRWGVAPSITFGMQSKTKLTASFYHMQSSELPDTGLPFNNPFTTGPNVAKNGDGTPLAVPRETFYGLVNRDFRTTSSDIGTLDLRHEFNNGLVLRNVTRYGKSTNDYVWTQPDDSKGNVVLYNTVWRRANTRKAATDALANASSLSGEFKLGGIKHSFTTGLEWSREDTGRTTYLFAPGTNPGGGTSTVCPTSGAATQYNCAPLLNPNPNDPWVYTRSESPGRSSIVTNTRSVYAFDTIELAPQWLLNAGLRWDDYKSDLNVPTYAIAGVTTAASHAQNNATFGSYQAGVVYKPAANSSIYLSYGTSSTPPGNDGGDGLDALTVAVSQLKPQESKNFELGTKWEILARRLSVSAAVFHSVMDNARVTAPDGLTQNVGRKKIKGVELGLSGSLSSKWDVFGGYTYLDAVVQNNGYANVGTTAAPVYVPSPFNGNRFPATPRQSATLWSSYAVAPGWVLGGGAAYVGKVYSTVNNTKWVPAYTRFDAMASYALNKHVTMQLNVQNLADKLYFDKVSSGHYAGVAAGRTILLTANMKF
ncbi:MAG: TonB-dependent siderophore receptor [Pseudomonadota bacterium]